MQLLYLSGKEYKKMVLGGSQLLEAQKKEVDALNVFPVPDGDTGTNMSLTILAAAKEVTEEEDNLSSVAQKASMGSLMGARGNSGVILSQILRGISKGFEGKAKVTAKDFAKALVEGAETAYRGVLKPVEGTILTVAREVGKAAIDATYASNDIMKVLEAALHGGGRALAKTPDLLPVLKQVGVVDAGGKGYLIILEGALKALKGEEITVLTEVAAPTEKEKEKTTLGEIEFHYCTELLVKGGNLPLDQMRSELDRHGDSLMVVGTEQVAKVHIHSNHPGKVLENCLKYGSLHEIKISNMIEQNEEMIQAKQNSQEQKEFSIISVSVGEGLREILQSLGVDAIIEGGQTLNPSTEDIVKAIKQVKGSKVIILPNNKNIILASEQAKSLVEDKEVVVIPSKSIPAGVAALVTLDQRIDFSVAVEKMIKAIEDVVTGEVTYAVRNSQFDGIEIKEGDTLGLLDGKIKVVLNNPKDVMQALIKEMSADKELITIYYGQEVSKAEAENLLQVLEVEFPEIEFELHDGGQPLYYYLISAE